MDTQPNSRPVLPLCASLLLLAGSLTACKTFTPPNDNSIIDGGAPVGDSGQPVVDGAVPIDASLPPAEVDGLDILFVVDNSGSMREEQASLSANFNRFVNVLNSIEGGLPDVHIGVVSTDLGAGPFGIAGCDSNGDNGILQSAPNGACMPPGPEPYISDVLAQDGVTRVKNYNGELADAFSCIVELGTTGCGFEQPLEAMRRALNGSNPQNNGFLRPNALLAVVIITDEDDCSVENVGMFDTNPALDDIDSELGPLSSFRCFEFGVQCTPDTPRSAGPRTNCVPRVGSQFMRDVGEYATFLKGLKANPNNVVVAGIMGNPTPVTVSAPDGEPTLDPSCVTNAGEADPAVRIQGLLNAFPQRSTGTTICNEDLSDALTVVAELLSDVVSGP